MDLIALKFEIENRRIFVCNLFLEMIFEFFFISLGMNTNQIKKTANSSYFYLANRIQRHLLSSN